MKHNTKNKTKMKPCIRIQTYISLFILKKILINIIKGVNILHTVSNTLKLFMLVSGKIVNFN